MEGKVARQDGLAYIALLRQSVSQSGLEFEASRKRTLSCMEVLKCIIRVPNGTAWWCMVLRTRRGGIFDRVRAIHDRAVLGGAVSYSTMLVCWAGGGFIVDDDGPFSFSLTLFFFFFPFTSPHAHAHAHGGEHG